LENIKLNAYLDFELTRRLEAFVVNALPEHTFRSDFNMLYLANIEIEEEDGKKYQKYVECDDTFFLSVVNDYGNIDYRSIKTIHVADVYETDFETMEYYPQLSQMDMFANYHENNPIPKGGGYLEIAYSPFGVNKIEMINGEILHIYGNGRIKVTEEMIGFKGYKQIPKVRKILSNDMLKILKIAMYTRYNEYMHRRYSLNIFSPTMREMKEEVEGAFKLSDDIVSAYVRGDDYGRSDSGIINSLKEKKNDVYIPANVDIGAESNIFGISNMAKVGQSGYIDMSQYADMLVGDFSIHFIAYIKEFASTGTVLFEAGYGLTDSGYQTHHLTLWVKPNGMLVYNGQYSDEWIETGYIVKKDMENIFTVTVENQKYDEDDKDEYVIFIHVNGKQVWPKERMYTKTEKIYIWRAMEAYRTYNEVCMTLPSPHPVSGGLDAKSTCARKLLHESGFVTLDNLYSVYELYLNRPRPSKADPVDFIFGDSDRTTIKKLVFGQDSELDMADDEYYFDGGFTDIALFVPSLNRDQIEDLHLMNILRNPSVELE